MEQTGTGKDVLQQMAMNLQSALILAQHLTSYNIASFQDDDIEDGIEAQVAAIEFMQQRVETMRRKLEAANV